MEIINTFTGYEIMVTHQNDGDMRNNEHLSNIIRPYPQVHGTDIKEYRGKSDESFTEIDGIYTKIVNTFIGGLCADCPIVLFLGKGEVAAVHSGWRGTKANIVSSALKLFERTPRNEIQVFIGPHIGPISYEVQLDFFSHFEKKYIHEREGRLYFDIEAVLVDRLLREGIPQTNIYSHGEDTYSDKKYFSYRRDGMIGVGCVSVKMLP